MLISVTAVMTCNKKTSAAWSNPILEHYHNQPLLFVLKSLVSPVTLCGKCLDIWQRWGENRSAALLSSLCSLGQGWIYVSIAWRETKRRLMLLYGGSGMYFIYGDVKQLQCSPKIIKSLTCSPWPNFSCQKTMQWITIWHLFFSCFAFFICHSWRFQIIK